MDATAAFFMDNIVYVYFFYGLAFVGLGLVVLLESGRASEFRFARALLPLALFGFLHGAHEWFEMFQIFAAHGAGYTPSLAEEIIGIASLVGSFILLLVFGMRLLPDAELNPRAAYWQVGGMMLLWLLGVTVVYFGLRPERTELFAAADVLARYTLAIPGSLFAAAALLRERRDFHARGMSQYGQALLWAALAFVVYGALGQLFTRPSLIAPSQVVNTALFLRTFGVPVQLLRGLAAGAIALALGSSLRAFEAESRLRLQRANEARLEAQAAALEAQQRRADEVEALNVELTTAARENERLYAVVREREARLEDLVRQLVTAQEGERQRISRELHDETGQKLSALGMGLAAVQRQLGDENVGAAARVVHDLRELNDQAITELRNIMADLRPAQLDDLGLVPALRWYVTQYAARHEDLAVNLTAGRLPVRLPPQHETVLFRAAQEALTNVARHACASKVIVSLHQEKDRVCMEVIDDGVGFDDSAPPRHAPGSGLGLVGMQERVALVDGECHVHSQPGRGTRIIVEVPLTDSRAEGEK